MASYARWEEVDERQSQKLRHAHNRKDIHSVVFERQFQTMQCAENDQSAFHEISLRLPFIGIILIRLPRVVGESCLGDMALLWAHPTRVVRLSSSILR